MPLAIFGINNTALSLAVTFVILSLVAIWIALIVFTFIDARRRIADPFLVGCATAASLFPFVGTVVYTILRPAELLEDVRERDIEMRSAESELRHREANSCHKCGFPTHPDYVRCPACRSRLKEPCPSCDRPVGLKWKVCPYCEHTLIASKRTTKPGRSSKSSKARRTDEAAGERGEAGQSRQPERSSRSGRSSRGTSSGSKSTSGPTSGSKSARGSSSGSPSARGTSSRSGSSRNASGEEGRPQDSGSGEPASPGEETSRRGRRATRSEGSASRSAGSSRRDRPDSPEAPSVPGQERSSTRRRIVVEEDDTQVAHRPINSGESVSPAVEGDRG
jgi:predicted Zn-ribbon and HTH transcriptional regulator